jgi:hypothetical protein
MTLIESAKAPPDGHVDGGASADAGRGFMDPVPLLTAGQRTLLPNHLARLKKLLMAPIRHYRKNH